MKANNELKSIDIIYPDTMKEALPNALIICEGFIDRLFQAKFEIVKIKINTNLKLVECNDPPIKNYLDLTLKAKKLNLFYTQFIALLHKDNNNSVNNAKLKCYKAGKSINFIVSETNTFPDFSWEVARSVN